MKLTKATENGFNLWVVEHNGPGVSKIRTMYQASTLEVDLTDAEHRARVAQELWRMRRDCRALAEAGPPA